MKKLLFTILTALTVLIIFSVSANADVFEQSKYLTGIQDINTLTTGDCDCSRLVVNRTAYITTLSYKFNPNSQTAVFRGYLFNGTDNIKPSSMIATSTSDMSVSGTYPVINFSIPATQVLLSNNYWNCVELISGYSGGLESTGITSSPTGDDSWNYKSGSGCLAGGWGASSRLSFSAGTAWYSQANTLNIGFYNLTPANNSYNFGKTLQYFYNVSGAGLTSANCSFFWNGTNVENQSNRAININYNFNVTKDIGFNQSIPSSINCSGNNGIVANTQIKYVQWDLSTSLNIGFFNLSPQNNFINNNNSLAYYYNVTGLRLSYANCSFFWNGTNIENKTNAVANTTYFFNVTKSKGFNESIQSWINCSVDNNLFNNSQIKTVQWDLTIIYNLNPVFYKLNPFQRITYPTITDKYAIFLNANFSSEGIGVNGSLCNISANNISTMYAVTYAFNYTFSNSQFINYTISEATNNWNNDTIYFRLCKNNIYETNINVLINNNLLKQIIDKEIPLCTNGYDEEVITFNNFSDTNINATLLCFNCSINSEWVMTKNNYSYIFTYERNFKNYSFDVSYNTTSKIYENKNKFMIYKFGINNSGNINLRCNETNFSTNFNVTNIPLNLEIVEIDNIPFTNGMSVESSEETNIIIDVRNDYYHYLSFNLTNSSGTIIKSSNLEYISVNQSELSKIGIYNISIFVRDEEGTSYFKKVYFILNDTTISDINSIYPTEDNLARVTQNVTASFTAQFYDVNLFAFEYLVYNPNNILLYNFTVVDLNSSSYNFQEYVGFSELGMHRINITVYDDHTTNVIEEFNKVYVKNDRTLSFEIENIIDRQKDYDNITIQYTGKYAVTNIETKKLEDRYTWNYDISYEQDIILDEVENSFKISCENLIFRPNSKHTAHFVCWKSHKWIDFDTEGVKDWYVKKLSDNEFEVTIISTPIKILQFNSIGNLNIASETVNFEVITTPLPLVSLFNFDFNNSAHVLLLLGIIILYLGCNFIGFMFGNIMFMGLGMFFGMILGILLASISMIFAIVFFIISIIIYYSMSKILR